MLREENEMSLRNSNLSDIEIDNDLIIRIPKDTDIVELHDFEKIDDNNKN